MFVFEYLTDAVPNKAIVGVNVGDGDRVFVFVGDGVGEGIVGVGEEVTVEVAVYPATRVWASAV